MIWIILLWNVLIFLLYGIDKSLAQDKKKTRIPEALLILPTALLGGVGAICGMMVFHHKTNKLLFRIVITISFLVTEYMLLVYIK